MILKIDVIFYCAGETLSDFKIFELGILKLFKKRIIFTFHGSDARPPYISGVHYKSKKPDKYSLAYIHKITKSTYKKVKTIEKELRAMEDENSAYYLNRHVVFPKLEFDKKFARKILYIFRNFMLS